MHADYCNSKTKGLGARLAECRGVSWVSVDLEDQNKKGNLYKAYSIYFSVVHTIYCAYILGVTFRMERTRFSKQQRWCGWANTLKNCS